MGEEVENDTEFPPVSKALVKAKILSKAQADEWNDHLKTTYDQVLALHRQNWNGIWFRIVRNFFGQLLLDSLMPLLVIRLGYDGRISQRHTGTELSPPAKSTPSSDTKFHGGKRIRHFRHHHLPRRLTSGWSKMDGWCLSSQTVFQSPSSQASGASASMQPTVGAPFHR